MAQTIQNRQLITPHYPFETCGKSVMAREKIERTFQSRASLPSASLQNFHYRGHRLHNYGHPSVISSTQQLLALTPTKFGVSPIWRKAPTKRSSSAKDPLPPMTSSPLMTQRNMTSPLSSVRGNSAVKSELSMLAGKRDVSANTTNVINRLNVEFTAPQISPHNNSVIKMRSLQAYQDTMRSYYGPRRNDPTYLARKMAPVLRVVPATTKLWIRETRDAASKEKSNEVLDGASPKRVRFSDQMGLPLVRNMTPNYRRKHSYILRWLETAGRPIQPIA